MLSMFPCCLDPPAGDDEPNLLEAIPAIEPSGTKNASLDSIAESIEGEPEDKKTASPEAPVTDETQQQPSTSGTAVQHGVQVITETPPSKVQVITETPPTKDESIISPAELLNNELPLEEEPDVPDVNNTPAVEGKDEPAVEDELGPIVSNVFTKTVTLGPGILGVKFDGTQVVSVTPGRQASNVGIKKGYRVLTFGEMSAPEDAPATEQSKWLQEQLQAPRPVQVKFERPVLETVFEDGSLGLKFKGSKVIDVTPDLQASKAGVQTGCMLLSFGEACVPAEKTEAQLVEWLEQRLKAPRPIVVKFEHPSTLTTT